MTTGPQSAFAAAQGWSRSYVSKLKDQDRLVFTADGLVDFAASLERIKATSGAPERAAPAVQGPDLASAIDAGKIAEAHTKVIELQKLIGSLMRVEDVAAAQADALVGLRQQLVGMAPRLAAEAIACAGDEARMVVVFSAAIETALNEAHRVMKRVFLEKKALGA